MRNAIIVDVDGCLVDIDELDEHLYDRQQKGKYKDRKEFLADFEKKCCDSRYVSLNQNIVDLCNLYYSKGFEIIVLTARSNAVRKDTFKLLTQSIFGLPEEILLIMRNHNEEGIPDNDLKARKVADLVENYRIELAIDDKEENCFMFKSMFHITSLQVCRERELLCL